MVNFKKIFAVGAISVFTLGALAGCTQNTDLKDQINNQQATILTQSEKMNELSNQISTLNNKLYTEEKLNEVELKALKTNIDSKIVELEKIKAQEAQDKKVLDDIKQYVERLELENKDLKKPKNNSIVITPNISNDYYQYKDIDDIPLGTSVTGNTIMSFDNKDLDKLFSGEIEFNNDNYDVKEYIYISPDAIIETSISDEDFGADPYMVLAAKNAIKYKYYFKDAIDMTEISEDEPLEIDFLGQPIKIIEANANEIVIKEGKELFMKEGESTTYNNLDISVLAIGSNKVYLKINDESKTIEEGQTKTIAGVDVRVEEVFDSDEGNDFTTITVSQDVERTIKNGNEYIKDNKEYIFNIETNGNKLDGLTVNYNKIRDDLNGKYTPLKIGEEIKFPNDYFTVKFEGITSADYNNYDFSFTTFDSSDLNLNNEKVIQIESSENDGFKIVDDYYDTIYFNGANVFYTDSDGDDKQTTFANVRIDYGDTLTTLSYNTTNKYLYIDLYDIGINIGGNFEYLGNVPDDYEKTEVTYNGNGYGSNEKDVLLTAGAIIETPKSNGDNDEVSVLIPDSEIEATVRIY